MKKESSEKSDLFRDGKEVIAVDLACDDMTVSLTPHKIILWFGRQAGDSSIREVIFGISSIDPSVNLEQEIICEFNNIAEYENMGYVLTSYGKTKSGYLVIFNIPFSRKVALAHFVRSIVLKLRENDVKKTLHWDGSPVKINMLYNKLKNFDGFEIKRIEFKDKDTQVL
ncbi:MAG: hypothetical protein O8C61_06555 [Candidatus Methanoperedens sp.]|nr:hypothetical protein [Candidatus Methanoperedens sp.]